MRKIGCLLGITALLIHALGCGGGEGTGGVYDTTSTGAGGGNATSTGTGSHTGSTGVSGGSSGTGGGSYQPCIPPTNGCGGPDQCGPSLPVVQLMKDVPAAQGGFVDYGTYWITAINEYTGTDSDPLPDGPTLGATYVFSPGKVTMSKTVALPGSPAQTDGQSGTFVTSGSSFTLSTTCGNVSFTEEGSYTSAGGTIHLYEKNNGGYIELVLVMQ